MQLVRIGLLLWTLVMAMGVALGTPQIVDEVIRARELRESRESIRRQCLWTYEYYRTKYEGIPFSEWDLGAQFAWNNAVDLLAQLPPR